MQTKPACAVYMVVEWCTLCSSAASRSPLRVGHRPYLVAATYQSGYAASRPYISQHPDTLAPLERSNPPFTNPQGALL